MGGGEYKSFERAPCAKTPFTVGDLKKAIPPHCFQPSLVHSFSYILYDLALASIFYFIAITYFHLLPSPYSYLAWPVYWACQGCISFGIWIIGHECGHHAFSDYEWVDDMVGFVIHTTFLVPYFSWKYSHRGHHSNIGCLDRDEVFVPKRKSQVIWFSKYLNNPPGRLVFLLIMLTLGWPLHLAFNIAGSPYDHFACHYDPYGPIFKDHERAFVYIPDAGIAASIYVLYRVAVVNGIAWLICIYCKIG